ncbi:hypothetical protein, partial [Arthrobacter sp. 179]|uniref:hypothetical protein n=1 Tax=Arthrobacter sp. 179 TaxID=3457734 RepID=UPI0040337470
THDLLGFTHTMDGQVVGLLSGEEVANSFTYAQVTILLESDVQPELLQSWEWPEFGDELLPIPNF